MGREPEAAERPLHGSPALRKIFKQGAALASADGRSRKGKTETLNAERAIANSKTTGKAANRMDAVKTETLKLKRKKAADLEFPYTRCWADTSSLLAFHSLE